MTQFNDHLLQIETCKNFNDMLLHLAKYFMNGDIFVRQKNWEFKEFNRLVNKYVVGFTGKNLWIEQKKYAIGQTFYSVLLQ